MTRQSARRTRRRLIDTAAAIGALTLAASLWTRFTTGTALALALLAAAGIAQTIENRLGPPGSPHTPPGDQAARGSEEWLPAGHPEHHHDEGL